MTRMTFIAGLVATLLPRAVAAEFREIRQEILGMD